jgi:hypothetical protein
MKAIVEASKIISANLLAVFHYEVGTLVEYNPGFMLIAENFKSTRDYNQK